VEGVAVAGAAVAVDVSAGFRWWLFVALVLAPDLSMAGYLAGRRVGAVCYDAAHTELLPVALGAAGVVAGVVVLQETALIWLAHIGVDRALGYGLKYPSAFADTHLQRL
jgi:hypothetical protein